jgi:pimeloyl-ACP methyl ester carboxylesterase
MLRHCTALAAAILLAAPAGNSVSAEAPAGTPASATATAGDQDEKQPAPGDAAFAIFVRGTQIGREQASLARTDSGWIITSSGRTAPPLDFTITRFEIKYTSDWQPLEMTLEARARTVGVVVRTSFTLTTAINEILQGNTRGSRQDEVSPRTIVLPNNVFAGYEALAVRLWDAPAGTELPLYVAPGGEVKATVNAITEEVLTGPTQALATRRFELLLQNPQHPMKAFVVVDQHRRLVRLDVPDTGLQAVREDVSSVAVREQRARNPTDSDVSIKANGFNLAGTLTLPATVAGRLRHPAVLLVGGTSPADRDETIGGLPVFTELARALADSGHVVLRYDRRGTGQSGGRTDTATLSDYADDALAAVKWLGERDDVDKRKIVVLGHMDGGPASLIAAAGGKDIAGVITVDAAGASGADLVLMQQQKALDDLKLSDADRLARVALQKKIQAAVISGSGWEGVPEAMRRQADTPWFKSVLTYEPERVLTKVRQPILILHGDLDPAVPPSEADKLGELAKSRKKAEPAEVVHLPGVGNTLAAPGSADISTKAVAAIVEWIKKL